VVTGSATARSSAAIVDATKPAPPVVFPRRAQVPESAMLAVDPGAVREATSLDELRG
jgi:2,5-furandicarboxylate decarboxylase 1